MPVANARAETALVSAAAVESVCTRTSATESPSALPKLGGQRTVERAAAAARGVDRRLAPRGATSPLAMMPGAGVHARDDRPNALVADARRELARPAARSGAAGAGAETWALLELVLPWSRVLTPRRA